MAQSMPIAPYAEPLWSSRGYSPYHNETHFRLRNEVRDYVENEIIPYAAEWEKTGNIPPEVCPRSWCLSDALRRRLLDSLYLH